MSKLRFHGYWGDESPSEREELGPWVEFVLLAHSDEVGDQRPATLDDLARLPGVMVVPVGSVPTREQIGDALHRVRYGLPSGAVADEELARFADAVLALWEGEQG